MDYVGAVACLTKLVAQVRQEARAGQVGPRTVLVARDQDGWRTASVDGDYYEFDLEDLDAPDADPFCRSLGSLLRELKPIAIASVRDGFGGAEVFVGWADGSGDMYFIGDGADDPHRTHLEVDGGDA